MPTADFTVCGTLHRSRDSKALDTRKGRVTMNGKASVEENPKPEKRQDLFDRMINVWWGKMVFAAGMVAATWFMHREFTRLESGEVASMEVWAPVAALYRIAGLWGGLAIFIVLAVVFAVWGIKQLISGRE